MNCDLQRAFHPVFFFVVAILAQGTIGLSTGYGQVTDSAQLDGDWEELSYVVNGKPEVEWVFNQQTQTLVPTDVMWKLSSTKAPPYNRVVIRAGEYSDDGDLTLGKHRLDTSRKPHRIIFNPERYKLDQPVEGIFKLRGDLLVIALPNIAYDKKTKSYRVENPPKSFDQRNGTDGCTVYTLRRKTQK